jgi:hypothetical protein
MFAHKNGTPRAPFHVGPSMYQYQGAANRGESPRLRFRLADSVEHGVNYLVRLRSKAGKEGPLMFQQDSAQLLQERVTARKAIPVTGRGDP